jgi:hypothetical protein
VRSVCGQSSPSDFGCLQFLTMSRPRQYMITWVYVKACHPGEHKNHWQVAASFLQGESKTVLCTAGPQSMYMGGDLGGTFFLIRLSRLQRPRIFGQKKMVKIICSTWLDTDYWSPLLAICKAISVFWFPTYQSYHLPSQGFHSADWLRLKPWNHLKQQGGVITYNIIYIYLQSSIILTYLNIS